MKCLFYLIQSANIHFIQLHIHRYASSFVWVGISSIYIIELKGERRRLDDGCDIDGMIDVL